MKIRGFVLCTEQHLADTEVSVRMSKLRVAERKQGRGNEYSIPGDISEKTVKHGSHRRVMFIKMRVIKGIGKSRGKRQSPKGQRQESVFWGVW